MTPVVRCHQQRSPSLNQPLLGSKIDLAGLTFGGWCMPHYEFFCLSCRKSFVKILTIAEHETERTSCPFCGSQEVEQRWSAFAAITSKKSA